jgi:hypothetical protein
MSVFAPGGELPGPVAGNCAGACTYVTRPAQAAPSGPAARARRDGALSA